MDSKCDRNPQGNMFFVKKPWLCLIALVVVLCISLGTILIIRANRLTVYTVPESAPERDALLKRASRPDRHAYATGESEEVQIQDSDEDSSESFVSESSSQDTELDDTELESALLGIEDGAVKEKRGFPPVPEGFASNLTPVWLKYPGYQKGDMPEHELMYRVLIKLWNQGERRFINGVFRNNDGKVYPLYPDVVYVKWGYTETYDEEGQPIPVRYIATSLGTHARDFNTEDFKTGDWETKYPGTKFVSYDDSGYDPYSFLTEND